MGKKTLIIKADKFNTLEGFYDEIDRVLTKGLDWKTGHNMDAYNDLLRGGFGVFEYEEPVKIIWENSTKSKTDLSYKETVNHYELMLSRCHPTNIPRVKEKLEHAQAGKGETLFEILVSIIKEHKHIELELR